jgi:hypothetical protein
LILIFHDAMIHIIIAIFLSPILHFITYHWLPPFSFAISRLFRCHFHFADCWYYY